MVIQSQRESLCVDEQECSTAPSNSREHFTDKLVHKCRQTAGAMGAAAPCQKGNRQKDSDIAEVGTLAVALKDRRGRESVGCLTLYVLQESAHFVKMQGHTCNLI